MRSALALAVALGALLAALRPALADPRPDLVLIVIDTLRRDRLPFYGHAKDTAPFLTRLARESVVFENALTTAPWTAPATASLMTSRYPFQHGVVSGRLAVKRLREAGAPVRLNRIPRGAETIAEAMQRAGYATWAVTQNANITRELGFDQGFDHFLSKSPRREADPITDSLLELRPRLRGGRPDFVYLHYMDVHAPNAGRAPWFDAALSGDARELSAYDSELRYLDSHLERTFRALGWERSAIAIVTADHGEEFRDHGGWGHARTLFAEVLNVPLLVYAPGRFAAARATERVSLVDILPTLRALAGLPPSPHDSGLSLLPLLRGALRLPPRALFADLWHATLTERKRFLSATVEGEWKLIDGAPAGPMLFHLERDPLDLRNRLESYPHVAARLRARFAEGEARLPRLEAEFEEAMQDAAMNEDLRALGYVD
ncbi:MAG TPA: sulfatase [Vicinamibacteria bacterium]|nr:sulfatase [Vicinamibacteria bacterium]